MTIYQNLESTWPGPKQTQGINLCWLAAAVLDRTGLIMLKDQEADRV